MRKTLLLHIDHAADSDDREDRGQFGLQQDSQGLVTRQRTGALTAGLPSVEFVGALAIPMQPATSSATYGVCMPHVELAKFENFGAVAKYEGDCCRGQAVYAHEVPRQDSAFLLLAPRIAMSPFKPWTLQCVVEAILPVGPFSTMQCHVS